MTSVVVLGVTGRIGKRVARDLVARGHAVRGANRRPGRAGVLLPDLDIPVLWADTADPTSVRAVVAGADVVVLATAPTREDPEAYVEHNRSVIQVVRESGVPRLIALSNRMALRAPDGRPMLEAAPPHPSFAHIEALYAAERDVFRAEQELDWLLVAPPMELFPYGEATGRYTVGVDTLVTTDPGSTAFKQTSRLSMEDLAHFVVTEIEHPRYSRALVTLAYGQDATC